MTRETRVGGKSLGNSCSLSAWNKQLFVSITFLRQQRCGGFDMCKCACVCDFVLNVDMLV